MVMVSAKDRGRAGGARPPHPRARSSASAASTVVVLPGRRRARGWARALRLRRRLRPAGDRGQRLRADRPARARRSTATAGGRSSAGELSSATTTSRARSPPRRRPTASASTAPTSSTASCTRTSPTFRRQLREAAALYPGGEELLAAKIVGRWRDGTPLDASPDRQDPALVTDTPRNNAFDYGATRPACAARSARTSAA